MAGTEARDPLLSLVRVAVGCDDPARLIAAVEPELGAPLGLVGSTGTQLGHAPDTDAGRQALAVAGAAARSRLVAPPGWTIIPIARATSRLGFLAVGEDAATDAGRERLLDLLATLLADQLHRVALLEDHAATFVQRLVTDPGLGAQSARREAAELGLSLADSYWPAILAWRSSVPRMEVVETVAQAARALAGGSLTASLQDRIVLLHPCGDRGRVVDWLEQMIGHARSLAPSSRAQAIADDAPVEVASLSARVAELYALWQLGPRADPEQLVVSARNYALERLLRNAASTRQARAFVDDLLGGLLAWDREHGTNLVTVLEAALDFPRHDIAASRCFMHRNTFRHRHQQATEILGDCLEDPDVRLAVHVALKLRNVLPRSEGPAAADPRRDRVAARRELRVPTGHQRASTPRR
jgi:sugar diacid utilization regulator